MRAWKGVASGVAFLVAVGAAWAGEPDGPVPFHPHGFGVYLPNAGFDGKIVKGVPYQAEAVTEIVQTLADGNRIVRKTTSVVFRDSDGRTRRDQALGAIGPLVAAGGTPPTAFIHDPVAGVSYVLEAETRVARRMPMPPPRQRPAKDEVDETDKPSDFFFTIAVPGPDGRMPPPGHAERKAVPKAEAETLGHQTIEGIDTEGTRSTITIPAGDIGNEREMKVVSERWYSAELQTVILSKRTDPRLGETTYRLTGISRNEPDHALFEVPAGFTVKDGPPEMNFRYERRMDSTTPRNPAP